MRHEALQTIGSLREGGRLAEAIDLVDRLLDDGPDDGRAWEERGLLLDRLGESDEARDALERATTLVPLRPLSQCVLAELYAAMGQAPLAEEMLIAVTRHPAADSPSLLRVAASLYALGRTHASVEACRRSARLDPHAAAPLYAMGYYLERGGWPLQLAETMLRTALDYEPESVKYRVGLTAFLHRHARFAEAYAVAGQLSQTQLAELTCACCLVRLFDLFDRREDDERASICRARLSSLFGSGA